MYGPARLGERAIVVAFAGSSRDVRLKESINGAVGSKREG